MALERTKTIAHYLIKYTKANCDPRRFVKLIEKCCPEEVFSELEFNVRIGDLFDETRFQCKLTFPPFSVPSCSTRIQRSSRVGWANIKSLVIGAGPTRSVQG